MLKEEKKLPPTSQMVRIHHSLEKFEFIRGKNVKEVAEERWNECIKCDRLLYDEVKL